MEYRQTEEECLKSCKDKYCMRCGDPLSPIETVDNAGNPTFWSHCPTCMIFSHGTTKQIYDYAEQIHWEYPGISMENICGIIRFAMHLQLKG